MHVIVVRHGGDAVRALGVEQQVVGHRAAERGDALAFQIGERAIALAIAVADGEHFAELVIRDAGSERLAPRRNVFDAAQADVEVAALRGLIERGELHLQELRRPAKLAGDQLRDLDVEANELRGIARVGLDERRAAFGIAAPAQDLLRAERRSGSEREQHEQVEACPHLAKAIIVQPLRGTDWAPGGSRNGSTGMRS